MEYGLLVALLGAALIVVFSLIATRSNAMYDFLSSKLS